MPWQDRAKELYGQGYNNDEIYSTLMEEGYGPDPDPASMPTARRTGGGLLRGVTAPLRFAREAAIGAVSTVAPVVLRPLEAMTEYAERQTGADLTGEWWDPGQAADILQDQERRRRLVGLDPEGPQGFTEKAGAFVGTVAPFVAGGTAGAAAKLGGTALRGGILGGAATAGTLSAASRDLSTSAVVADLAPEGSMVQRGAEYIADRPALRGIVEGGFDAALGAGLATRIGAQAFKAGVGGAAGGYLASRDDEGMTGLQGAALGALATTVGPRAVRDFRTMGRGGFAVTPGGKPVDPANVPELPGPQLAPDQHTGMRSFMEATEAADSGLEGDELLAMQRQLGEDLMPEVNRYIGEGYNPVRAVGQALEDKAIAQWGRKLDPTNLDDRQQIVDTLTEDVLYALEKPDNASEWYRKSLQEAFELWGEYRPGMTDDWRNLDAARFALAITSNGQKVGDNAKYAREAFDYFMENGRFNPEHGWGKEKTAMQTHFRLFNELVDELDQIHMGADGSPDGLGRFFELLDTEITVKDLKDAGLTVTKEKTDQLLNASVMFGPKIGGGFFQNLGGNFDPLTVDRWFRRTMGRVTGDMMETYTPQQVKEAEDEFLALLNQRGGLGKGETVAEAAQRTIKSWNDWAMEVSEKVNKKGELVRDYDAAKAADKDMWSIAKAAEKWDKKANPGIREAPSTGTEIAALREIASELQTRVKELTGVEYDIAQLQAILWYPEKDLFARMGARVQDLDQDYAQAFKAIFTENPDESVRHARRPGTRPDQAPAALSGPEATPARRGGLSGPDVREALRAVGRWNQRTQLRERRRVQAGTSTSPRQSIFRRVARSQKDPARGRGADSRAVLAEYDLAPAQVRKDGGGRRARKVSEMTPKERRWNDERKAFQKAKISTPRVLELDPAQEAEYFHNQLRSALEVNESGAAAYLASPEELAGMRLFVTPDGKAGFALDGDNITAVFKDPSSKNRSWALYALRLAVAEGGRRLDAFDTILPDLYARAGFRPSGRIPFDDAQAPATWWKEPPSDGAPGVPHDQWMRWNDGRPDVVSMVYDSKFDGHYIPGSGDTVADYGTMVEKAKRDASQAGFIMPELLRLGGQTLAGAAIGGLAAAPEGGVTVAEGAGMGGLVGFGTGVRAVRRMAQEYAKDGLPDGPPAPRLAGEGGEPRYASGVRESEPQRQVTPSQEAMERAEEVKIHTFDVDPTGARRVQQQIARINEIAQGNPGGGQDIGMTSRSWDTEKGWAAEIGIDIDALDEQAAKRLTGSEMLAIRDVVSSNVDRIEELSKILVNRTDPDLETRMARMGVSSTDAAERMLNGLEQQNEALLKKFMVARTEAGRRLNALKIIATRTTDPAVWMAKARQVKGSALDDAEQVMINRLANQGDRVGMAQYVGGLYQAPLSEKLVTLWKAGLLTNPSTHLANYTGNISMSMLEEAKDYPAAAVDWAMTSIARAMGAEDIGRTKTYGGAKAVLASTQAFFENLGPAVQKSLAGEIDDAGMLQKYDVIKQVNFDNWVGSGFLNAYAGPNSRIFASLQAGDRVFKSVAMGRSLNEQATLRAMNEGLERGTKDFDDRVSWLVENDDAIILRAIQDAEIATFLNKGGHTTFASLDLAAAGEGLRKDLGPVGQVLMPFTRTPANILDRVLEYTPVGFAGNVSKIAKWMNGVGKAKAGEITAEELAQLQGLQREIVEQFGRGATGTLVVGLGMKLHDMGVLTGNYPSDTATRNQWELGNVQAHSLKVDGHYLNLDRLSPVGNLLTLGAELNRMLDNPDNSASDIATGSVGAIGKTVVEQSFLRGVQGALDALNDPERSMGRYVRQTAASVVPSVVGSTARAIDPTMREGESVGQAVQGRIPFASRELPARIDAFGRERTRETHIGGRLMGPISPVTTRVANEDDVTLEMQRVNASIPNASASITSLNRHLSAAGIDPLKRGDEGYEAAMRLYGSAVQAALTKVMADDWVHQLTINGERKDVRYNDPDVDDSAKALMLQQVSSQVRSDLTRQLRDALQQQGGR